MGILSKVSEQASKESGFGKILTFRDLQRIVAPDGPLPRPSTVVRWAEKHRVLYRQDGKGGIWTTVDALNAALGLRTFAAENEQKPEDLI